MPLKQEFMDDRTKAWLFEILKAIHEINSYFNENQKTLAHLSTNIAVKRAVERNLETLGDSLAKLISYMPGLKISNAERIIDTCRRIKQGNDTVSDYILWDVISHYLPTLYEEIHLMIIQQTE